MGGVDAASVLDASGRAFGGVAAASNWEGAAAVASLDAGYPVELLKQVMSGQLDLLMAPLRCPVDTGDEGAAVYPAEVSVDERLACLGLLPLRRPERPTDAAGGPNISTTPM